MARERTLKVTILGDSSSAQRAIRGVSGETKTLTGSAVMMGSRLRTAGLAIGAAAAGVGVAGKYILGAAMEAENANAQTQAAIKSTGGVANVTAKDITELAGRIRDYSGQSDEAVQAAQNVLLTFTDVRNEVGKGNDVFDQATKSIVDMSVRLGTDLQSASLQVGKALQDPVRGITALRRSGVSFSEAQGEVIKKLVETGKKSEAQRMILKELRKEFGGSARAAGDTFSGKLSILREKLGDVAEKIGAALIPVLSDMADWLIKNLPNIIQKLKTFGKVIVGIFRFIKGIVGPIVEFLIDRIENLINAVERAVSIAQSIGRAAQGDLSQEVAAVVGQVRAQQVGTNAGSGSSLPNKPLLRQQQTINFNVNSRKVQSETIRRDTLLGTGL